MSTSQIGDIKIVNNNNDEVILKDVLYSTDLTENLLSLRKFVDNGMKV